MADSKAILDEQLHKKAKGEQTKPLADVIAEWMRAELQSALQKAIDAEFSVHIGYEAGKKPEGSDDPNVRNGGHERTIDAEYGPVIVRMPRARESGFEPEVAPKYSRSTSFVADVVCALYRANLSGSQIREAADSLYGVGVSESRITAVVDAVAGDAESFRKSPLPKKALALFADSVFIPLRRGTVSREAVNILMAIGEDGYPYVVGFSITPEESASEWRSVFERVRQRGLEKAFVVVSGGIAGMAEAVKAAPTVPITVPAAPNDTPPVKGANSAAPLKTKAKVLSEDALKLRKPLNEVSSLEASSPVTTMRLALRWVAAASSSFTAWSHSFRL